MTESEVQRRRIVAISGAGTGIGQATAVKFAALGWQVVVGGRRVERLAETASRRAGGWLNALRCGETVGYRLQHSGAPERTHERGQRALVPAWSTSAHGFMTPDMVADAVVTAVTLPMTHQYEIMAVIPTAPVGDLPSTYEQWGAAMLEER